MEVIGAGWGRTGTLSLKTALETLGFPCYHMVDCLFKHPDHPQQWIHAAEGQPVDFDKMLAGYKACVDWPSVAFYKELVELYPNAKVVLTVRDPAKWHASLQDTIPQMCKAMQDVPWYATLLMGFSGPANGLAMIDKVLFKLLFQGLNVETEAEELQQLFKQHIEEVKKVVPAERLLVFQVSEGWEPLCAFLGKPVPDQPFPHSNDTESWRKMIAGVKRGTAMINYGLSALGVAALAGAVFVGLRALRR